MKNRRKEIAKKQLLFRIHIKSVHLASKTRCKFSRYHRDIKAATNVSSTLNQLFFNYMITYPLGKIQLKWTYNACHHNALDTELNMCLKGMDAMFRIAKKEK